MYASQQIWSPLHSLWVAMSSQTLFCFVKPLAITCHLVNLQMISAIQLWKQFTRKYDVVLMTTCVDRKFQLTQICRLICRLSHASGCCCSKGGISTNFLIIMDCVKLRLYVKQKLCLAQYSYHYYSTWLSLLIIWTHQRFTFLRLWAYDACSLKGHVPSQENF